MRAGDLGARFALGSLPTCTGPRSAGLAMGSVILATRGACFPWHGDSHGGAELHSREIREAAEIDGAGFWRRLFQITTRSYSIMSIGFLFGIVFTFIRHDRRVRFGRGRSGPQHSGARKLVVFKGIEGNLAQGAASLFSSFRFWPVGAVMLKLAAARRGLWLT